MQGRPPISVITVVKNGGQTLSTCIESVKRQQFPAEHILVDGGSSDSTMKIIQDYKSSVRQSQYLRVKWISESDQGIYDAMNKGLSYATGEIIAILNADDFYANNNVFGKVAAVFKDSTIDSCYGDLTYVDANDTSRMVRFWRSGEYNMRKFFWGWMPPHPTFFARRETYRKCGNFKMHLGTAADYELMLRFLVKYKITSTYLPEVLVYMRAGGISAASISNRIKANLMDRKAWKVNHLRPYPWTVYLKPLRKIRQFVSSPKIDGLADCRVTGI